MSFSCYTGVGKGESGRRGEKSRPNSPPLSLSLSPQLSYCLLCASLLLSGCPSQTAHAPATPRASVALRVLVVNEPDVAEAINRLRGEWAEQSGGQLSATSKTWAELAAGKDLDADAIIFPSRYLGELCVREWLRPVRTSVLESDKFKAADVFPFVRNELMKWGGEPMALPLGIDCGPTSKALKQHPGFALLVAAAPAAVTDKREGVLFDPKSMKPRIGEAPFVAALEQKIKTGFDPNESVPVIGLSDRMIAVSAESRNAASAFKLIAWLASAEISTQLAMVGDPMLPARRSLASSSAWYSSSADTHDRAKRGELLIAAMSGKKCLLIPRIPGIDEYLSALDEAVESVSDKVPAQVALGKASERWEQITNAHGRDVQQRAYLAHLGISQK
jgi:multiple sugar transport system substrate-binding protein